MNNHETLSTIKRCSQKKETDFQDRSKVTQQSSQRFIVTEATFEYIDKERDALIDRLKKQQQQLLNILKLRKQELYELQKQISEQNNNNLVKLNQSYSLKKIVPDC